ncbi:uncharacterized protein LOC118183015 [Stegodyphus dumicola]|uniref:uncharacterized protein LOC118183015 n=1 Tax=Stegodyphus dumicola TaxID=202533 RepID=UPI0015ABCBA2|nr:uncharacterized protein LOC118183015 [Stegodyphus dumicola]
MFLFMGVSRKSLRDFLSTTHSKCVCTSYLLLLTTLIGSVKGGSVAVFGNRGGGHGETTERWGVISPGTQIFLLILGGVLSLFALYGLYRLYLWCKTNPRKGHH